MCAPLQAVAAVPVHEEHVPKGPVEHSLSLLHGATPCGGAAPRRARAQALLPKDEEAILATPRAKEDAGGGVPHSLTKTGESLANAVNIPVETALPAQAEAPQEPRKTPPASGEAREVAPANTPVTSPPALGSRGSFSITPGRAPLPHGMGPTAVVTSRTRDPLLAPVAAAAGTPGPAAIGIYAVPPPLGGPRTPATSLLP